MRYAIAAAAIAAACLPSTATANPIGYTCEQQARDVDENLRRYGLAIPKGTAVACFSAEFQAFCVLYEDESTPGHERYRCLLPIRP